MSEVKELKIDSSDLKLINDTKVLLEQLLQAIGGLKIQEQGLLARATQQSNRLQEIIKIALERSGIPAENHDKYRINPETGDIISSQPVV